VKNIAGLVRVRQVRLGGGAAMAHPALPPPDKPSIAALPFQDMTGDSEQEYFSNGIVENTIACVIQERLYTGQPKQELGAAVGSLIP
jgi:adenylate cyclase